MGRTKSKSRIRTIKIPAKYNTQTTLGYETERGKPYADFDLKSR